MAVVQEQRKKGGITGKGFMPGKCANPGGRPKGLSLTKALNAYLREHPDKLLAVGKALVDQAQSGDTKAIDLIWNRLDGKVVDRVLTEERQRVLVEDESPDA